MYVGPKISTDGLLLTLDAGNIKSFKEPTTNIAGDVYYSSRTYGSEYVASSWGGDYAVIYYYQNGGYNGLSYKKMIKTLSGTGGSYLDDNRFFPIEVGKTYTISCYMKANQNITPIYSQYSICINDNGGGGGNYELPSNPLYLTTDWQRFSWSYVADWSGTTYQSRHIVYEDISLPLEVYWCGFQVEEKDHVTPFVNGTRGNTVATGGGWKDLSGNINHGELSYSSSGISFNTIGELKFDGTDGKITLPVSCYPLNENVSVEIVMRRNSDEAVVWASSGLFFRGDWAGTDFYFMRNTSGSSYYGDSSWANWVAIKANFDAGQLVHLIYTHDVVSGVWCVYLNGKLSRTITVDPNSYIGLTESMTDYTLGYGAGTYMEMDISLYRHYNRVLSNVEVARNFDAIKERFSL